QQACDALAEALERIAHASRLDDKGVLDPAEWAELAGRIARVCPAFGPDEIAARALQRRVAGLGLSETAYELLTLLEAEMTPLDMLQLSDDRLRALVAELEAELGEP